MFSELKTPDAHTRIALQERALKAALHACDLDPTSPRALFQLSAIQCSVLNLADAYEACQKSVSLDPTQVRSWHLLVLILVALNKDFVTAKNMCQLALNASEWDVAPDGSGSGQGSFEEGEDVFQLCITEILLQKAMLNRADWHDQANDSLGRLFTLYSRVYSDATINHYDAGMLFSKLVESQVQSDEKTQSNSDKNLSSSISHLERSMPGKDITSHPKHSKNSLSRPLLRIGT